MPGTMPLDRLHLVNVTITSKSPLTLRCDDCGATWSPLAHQSDYLRANYWVCPENCCNEALTAIGLGTLGQIR